jgi:hypothetical protein
MRIESGAALINPQSEFRWSAIRKLMTAALLFATLWPQ